MASATASHRSSRVGSHSHPQTTSSAPRPVVSSEVMIFTARSVARIVSRTDFGRPVQGPSPAATTTGCRKIGPGLKDPTARGRGKHRQPQLRGPPRQRRVRLMIARSHEQDAAQQRGRRGQQRTIRANPVSRGGDTDNDDRRAQRHPAHRKPQIQRGGLMTAVTNATCGAPSGPAQPRNPNS